MVGAAPLVGSVGGGEAYTLEPAMSLLVGVVRAGLPPPASVGPVGRWHRGNL